MTKEQTVSQFLMSKGSYFPTELLPHIQQQLLQVDEQRIVLLYSADFREPIIVFLVSLFLGYLGVDRFLIGDIGLGIAKLLTAGLCGVWVLIDLFLIIPRTKEYNYERLQQMLAMP